MLYSFTTIKPPVKKISLFYCLVNVQWQLLHEHLGRKQQYMNIHRNERGLEQPGQQLLIVTGISL